MVVIVIVIVAIMIVIVAVAVVNAAAVLPVVRGRALAHDGPARAGALGDDAAGERCDEHTGDEVRHDSLHAPRRAGRVPAGARVFTSG